MPPTLAALSTLSPDQRLVSRDRIPSLLVVLVLTLIDTPTSLPELKAGRALMRMMMMMQRKRKRTGMMMMQERYEAF